MAKHKHDAQNDQSAAVEIGPDGRVQHFKPIKVRDESGEVVRDESGEVVESYGPTSQERARSRSPKGAHTKYQS